MKIIKLPFGPFDDLRLAVLNYRHSINTFNLNTNFARKTNFMQRRLLISFAVPIHSEKLFDVICWASIVSTLTDNMPGFLHFYVTSISSSQFNGQLLLFSGHAMVKNKNSQPHEIGIYARTKK